MLQCSICGSENEMDAVTCLLCGALLVEQFKTRPPDSDMLPEKDSLESYLSKAQDSLDLGLHAPSEDLFSGAEGDFLLPSEDSLTGFQWMDENAPTRSEMPAYGQPVPQEETHQSSSMFSGEKPTPVAVERFSPTTSPEEWENQNPSGSGSSLPPTTSPTHAIVVYFQRKPAFEFPLVRDKVLIGRVDPATQNYPDLDLTQLDPESAISRKHLYLTREDGTFYIHPISSAGTQINRRLLAIGNKVEVVEGDVIVLSGRIAMRFVRL